MYNRETLKRTSQPDARLYLYTYSDLEVDVRYTMVW